MLLLYIYIYYSNSSTHLTPPHPLTDPPFCTPTKYLHKCTHTRTLVYTYVCVYIKHLKEFTIDKYLYFHTFLFSYAVKVVYICLGIILSAYAAVVYAREYNNIIPDNMRPSSSRETDSVSTSYSNISTRAYNHRF